MDDLRAGLNTKFKPIKIMATDLINYFSDELKALHCDLKDKDFDDLVDDIKLLIKVKEKWERTFIEFIRSIERLNFQSNDYCKNLLNICSDSICKISDLDLKYSACSVDTSSKLNALYLEIISFMNDVVICKEQLIKKRIW